MNGIQTVNQRQQSLSDEQLFAHLKCEVLESMRQVLTTSLIPDRHMDFLRSRHILSEEDCDEISHPPTRRKRASTFLNILGKKGAEAYDALCEALRQEGTQTFLLRQLHEDFEQRLLRYRELVEQQNQQQALLPISPPSLQPPSPSTPLHHGNILQPTEHVSPGGATPPLSPSSASCPGCASCVSNTSGISTATGQSREEEGVVSLQKPRLNVAQYLQSLTIREESPAVESLASSASSTSSFQVISSPGSGFSQITSEASIDHLLPSFLSTRASHGSSTDSLTSFSQSGPSAAFSQSGPSAAFNQSVPSAAFNQSVPSAPFSQSGPSAAFSQLGPSAAFNQSGPSAAFSQSGSFAAFNQSGPSATFSQSVAATACQSQPSGAFSLSGPPAAFTQPALPTSDLPVPAQASKLAEATGDHTIVRQHHQHQPLSSRGFPQEFGSSPLPGEGGSTGLPSFPVPATSRPEPTENEDVGVESSLLQEPSFFSSLVGGSLAPPTLEAACSSRPILCDAALRDQHKALGKCADSHDDAQTEREENNNAITKQDVSQTPKPYSKMLNTGDDNITVTKMKVISNSSAVSPPSLSSPETPGACFSGEHMVWSSTAAAKPAQPESACSSSGVSAERKMGTHDVDPKDDGFGIVEGLSGESRNSVHSKDGHSLYSSRC